MDNEQGVSVPLDTDAPSHERRDTDPSDELSSLILKALAFIMISTILGRDAILLAFEVIALAWAINRLESHNDTLDRRAADRQARLVDACERQLEILSGILDVFERDLSQVEADEESDEWIDEESDEETDEKEVESNGESDEWIDEESVEETDEEEVETNGESDEWIDEESVEETDGGSEEVVNRESEEEANGGSEEEATRESARYVDHARVRGQAAVVQQEVQLARPSAAERATVERDRTRRLQQEEEERHRPAEVTIDLPFPLMLNDPCTTCIGTTKKGTRCQNSFISGMSRSQAMRRIEIMKSTNPGNSFEWVPLKDLADWMLCPRWHRDKIPQGREIANRWYAELGPARDALARRQTGRNQNSTALPRTFNTGASFGFGSPSSVSSSPGRGIFTPARTPLSQLQTPQSSAHPNPNSRPQAGFGSTNPGTGNPAVNLSSTFAALAAEAR